MEVEARRYNWVALDSGTWVHNASISGIVRTCAISICITGFGARVISAFLMLEEGLACLSIWRRSWMLAIGPPLLHHYWVGGSVY